jgi:hypothetical protein
VALLFLARLFKSPQATNHFMEIKKTQEDLRHFEFLAQNSKEIIEKQVDSYRQQHTYAGTIIGFTVLFIPFFLNSLDRSYQVLQFISILPIALFIGSILLMLSIFRGKPLDQALSVTKYRELLPKSYKEVLLYEIEANKTSYIKNNAVTLKGNKRYLQGVGLTTIAILISIVLLMVNTFIAIEKAPTKVRVVNSVIKPVDSPHALDCKKYVVSKELKFQPDFEPVLPLSHRSKQTNSLISEPKYQKICS